METARYPAALYFQLVSIQPLLNIHLQICSQGLRIIQIIKMPSISPHQLLPPSIPALDCKVQKTFAVWYLRLAKTIRSALEDLILNTFSCVYAVIKVLSLLIGRIAGLPAPAECAALPALITSDASHRDVCPPHQPKNYGIGRPAPGE